MTNTSTHTATTAILRRCCALLSSIAALVTASGAHAQTVRPCQPNDSTASQAVRFAAMLVSDSGSFARSVRITYGIPVASAGVVSRVATDSLCDAATRGLDAWAETPFSEALITVELGTTPRFYLLTRPVSGVMGAIFLLDGQFNLLTSFGTQ